MILLLILSSILIGFGLYQLICEMNKLPTTLSSKLMRLSINKNNNISLFNIFVLKICSYINIQIKLPDEMKNNLSLALVKNNNKINAEKFFLFLIIKSLIILIYFISFLLFNPIIYFFIFILTLTLEIYTYSCIFKKLNLWKETIKNEINNFLFVYAEYQNEKDDFINFLNDYKEIAGLEFKKEIIKTLDEVKINSRETSLLRMKNKINIPLFNDIIENHCISKCDRNIYFHAYCLKNKNKEHENFIRFNNKLSNKIQNSLFLILINIILFDLTIIFIKVLNII